MLRQTATPVLAVFVMAAISGGGIAGQSRAGLDVVTRAAEALGGRDRLLSLRTLTIEGYGQLAYQNGGGNITSSRDAPQKWIDINGYSRVVDLQNFRTRVRQRQVNDFVFAAAAQMRGVTSTQGLDGDVAFNINATGAVTRAPAAAARARRMEMLAHPIVAVRAALDSRAKIANQRETRGECPAPAPCRFSSVDVTVPTGDTFTLTLDAATSLPHAVSWTGPDANLGDLIYTARFTGYQPVSGILMPTGMATSLDFRGIVQQKLYVDRHALDAPIDDLSAPASLRSVAQQPPAAPQIGATEIAKGIWFLAGAGNSVLFEFDDHLTLFEVYASEANALAVIQKARSLVPGKPLTEVIVSHHHFDHTGGLRAAVAEGLTIVTQRGNEAFMREVTGRPAKLFPDGLGRNPRSIRVRAVDDHLKMRDASMEIDVYRVVANSHMADGLMVYVPRDRLLVQGDLFDVNWEIYWWGSSYMDNVRHRKLAVDRDVPVHGKVLPLAEVQQHIERQIANAEKLCAEVEAARLTMRGCPVKRTVDR
jgi:glyoxylase-like metal-dependent hydrolase (beta-lactamase superfamily II)